MLIDLKFPAPVRRPARTDDLRKALDYQALASAATDFVSKSKFFLLETLAERLAAFLLREFNLKSISLKVAKPQALENANLVGVSITRKKPL